jgi:abhydrolase domain-containing protein 14
MHQVTTNETLELDGASVHWLEAGPPDGPCVLLLHGARFRGATWLEVGTPRVLAQAGWRTIALDLPGFGESQESAVPREAFLERFTDALGLESCVVVTPSMSGSFALPFAARSPDRVTALVALAPVSIDRWAPVLAPQTRALLIWGSEDRTVPVAHAQRLMKHLPSAVLEVLSGAGHPAYLEQPERFHELLLKFLDHSGPEPARAEDASP